MPSRARWGAARLGVLLLAGALLPASAWAHPAANLVPVPDFDAPCQARGGAVVAGYCAFDAAGGAWTVATPAREQAALAALARADALLGLPAPVLPAGWDALGPDRQQFVLVNLARVAAGLPPLVAEARGLDALAQAGAASGGDPQPAGRWTAYASASNWAADAQPAAALYDYLFLDGWGGSAADTPNLDCTGPGAAGCWGHRRAILGDYGPAGLMGAAAVPGAGTSTGASAQIFVAYDGPPVPLSYTWADALRAGAAGGLPPGEDPPGAALWPFADMDAEAWAAGPAAALRLLSVVRGTGPGTFSPAAPLELQDFLTLLGRALSWQGAPAAAPAGTAAYARGAVGAAVAAGLLPPGASPAAAVTRGEAAGLIVAALGLPAAGLPSALSGGVAPAEAPVLGAAVAAGILRGTGAGLDAGAPLSRAQAAVLVLRALLARVRAGSGPGSAAALPGGAVLYRLGPVEALAPSALSDPTAYWLPAGGAILLSAAGSWWNGTVAWHAEAAPSWAASAAAYGAAVADLWPAGEAGAGPALFADTVREVDLDGAVQVLAPGTPAWVPAPAPGLLGDPGLAVAAAG